MLDTLLPLLLFLFPLAYSPGPGNMFFAANGAAFGLVATLPASLGYHAATLLVTLAIGFGFSASQAAPYLPQVLQMIGAIYVFWLAFGFFRAGAAHMRTEARKARAKDGIILLLVNPKAYVIIGLMFSQVQSHSAFETMAIAFVFTLNNMLAFLAWTIAGDHLGRMFRSNVQARWLNISFGMMLTLVALWMLPS